MGSSRRIPDRSLGGALEMATRNRTRVSARERPQRSTRSGSASAIDILKEADAMHAELLEQCWALMNSRAGSKRSRDLERIATIVEGYESKRWGPSIKS